MYMAWIRVKPCLVYKSIGDLQSHNNILMNLTIGLSDPLRGNF